ncbi:MAG: type II secretion system protein N [Hyphomonadaceae bacterium]|nr:type II secretion system protein N [Hyphomonadaceae bacterium]
MRVSITKSARSFGEEARRSDWRSRAASAVRPSVEALLLAAVALGCAQAGWGALTPHDAGASGAAPADDAHANLTPADVRTPFNPTASAEGASNAVAALAANVTLVGVRMADEPGRSGAVLSLEDGAQRAFVIGQEISAGLRLSAVQPDHVVIAFDGGERRLAMAAPARASFALALMGQAEAPAGPALATAAPEEPVMAAAAAPAHDGVRSPFAATAAAPAAQPMLSSLAVRDEGATPEHAAWLAATLAQVESRNGAPYGWRVAAPAPDAARAAGVEAGDLVLSVNGAGPARALEALSAAAGGDVVIEIERADGARATVTVQASART